MLATQADVNDGHKIVVCMWKMIWDINRFCNKHYTLYNQPVAKKALAALYFYRVTWLIDWRFYVPLNTKQVISEMFPKPVSWLGIEKLNLTQQKHTFTNQKKCTTTQNKHEKTKARFSRLLRQLAWKQRGPILILALHKFVTYLLT